jgi:hypothetical protein
MMIQETLKPSLSTPFPNTPKYWKCPLTGIRIPKDPTENVLWRGDLLRKAEKDIILQQDLMSASSESLLFWINAFTWTFHQKDIDPITGMEIAVENEHVPFITWEVQDTLFKKLLYRLKHPKSILIDKSRDMGASWCGLGFMHWVWLFIDDAQLLEMSRTKDYVDQPGNMKALFQKHDYINNWLPEWMVPPGVKPGEKYRTSMHMKNILNGACIDGESTNENAGSGDRRKVLLLDEFAKVEKGSLIRSATKDVSPFRIVNSTPAGPGTEYARWKKSGQIEVFQLPWWEHPDKGGGRHAYQTEHGEWKISSPWYVEEEKQRSPKEMAREVDMKDTESGDTFFTLNNIKKHIALFGCEPKSRFHIHLDKKIADSAVYTKIRARDYAAVKLTKGCNGPLRVWCNLVMNRPDQTKSYVFGCDISKGQGASNSVISIKCRETGEKIAEWRDANTPPFLMARVAVALAIWVGGRKPKSLPLIKWEKNGPGVDFGKQLVQVFKYPYCYYMDKSGDKSQSKMSKYGWHSSTASKFELLTEYDRVLAHGSYINHSVFGLEEAETYIYYKGGGIGPAELVEENSNARKTHGDVVIADALTLESKEHGTVKHEGPNYPAGSVGDRKKKRMSSRKTKNRNWRNRFDFER